MIKKSFYNRAWRAVGVFTGRFPCCKTFHMQTEGEEGLGEKKI